MSDEHLARSRSPGGAHHTLARMMGSWEGITKTWFEADRLADESSTRGRIRSVLDGRFVVYEYEGSLKARPLVGMAILGHHIDAGRFTMAWIDSFHMGTATMHAEGDAQERGFTVLGSYEVPGGPPWGWRTEFVQPDDDHLIITAYNISPRGEEIRAVETAYRRSR
jgi:hypothetical protein